MNSKFSKKFVGGLSALLIGITGISGASGCATSATANHTNPHVKIKSHVKISTDEIIEGLRNYFPKDETLRKVLIQHYDYNSDGRFDFYDALLISTGPEKLIRKVEVVYGYNSAGKIIENPLMVLQIVNWQENKNGKLIIITESSEKYDCGAKKISSRDELPKLTEYKPDGKFDYESPPRHIELPLSVQQAPNQENQYQTPEHPEQKPSDLNKPGTNPELEKKLKELEKKGKPSYRTET